jgi:hypothetical protein
MNSFDKLYEIAPETKVTNATIVLDTIQNVSFGDKFDDSYYEIYSYPSQLTKCCKKVTLRPNKHLNGKWSIVYDNSELSIYCNVRYDMPIENAGRFTRTRIAGNNSIGERVSRITCKEKINEVCIIPNSINIPIAKEDAMAATGRLVLRIDIPSAIHIVFPPHSVEKNCIIN